MVLDVARAVLGTAEALAWINALVAAACQIVGAAAIVQTERDGRLALLGAHADGLVVDGVAALVCRAWVLQDARVLAFAGETGQV